MLRKKLRETPLHGGVSILRQECAKLRAYLVQQSGRQDIDISSKPIDAHEAQLCEHCGDGGATRIVVVEIEVERLTKPLYETAITRRVKRLYHYQSYVEAYLESALRGTVRFSKPRDFNDPWDCKPWFNVPMDASGRERLIEWFDRTAHTRNPDMEAATRAQRTEELRRSPAMLSNLVQQASQGIEEEMKKRYRIYCLTTKSACPLMWAHYADKHRGICLEFDVWQPDLCSAIKVQYRETYPSFPLDNDDDISIFYTKSADWRYEDEYRLISEEAAFAFHSETLKTHDGFYTMPPGALKSVIVGALVPSETRSQIKGMVAQLAPDVIVREARCLSDQYQLEIEPTIAD